MSVHHLVILYQIFPDNNNFEISALEILSIFVTIEVAGLHPANDALPG